MFISGIFKHVKNTGNLFPVSRYVSLDKKLQYTSLLIKLNITPTSIFKNIRSQLFTAYSIFPWIEWGIYEGYFTAKGWGVLGRAREWEENTLSLTLTQDLILLKLNIRGVPTKSINFKINYSTVHYELSLILWQSIFIPSTLIPLYTVHICTNEELQIQAESNIF